MKRTEKERKRHQEVTTSLSTTFLLPCSSLYEWASVGPGLGDTAINENTHKVCGWKSNVIGFFGRVLLCVFVRFENLDSVMCCVSYAVVARGIDQ